MKTKTKKNYTYKAFDENENLIDTFNLGSSMRTAFRVFRMEWTGFIKIVCNETGEARVSKA